MSKKFIKYKLEIYKIDSKYQSQGEFEYCDVPGELVYEYETDERYGETLEMLFSLMSSEISENYNKNFNTLFLYKIINMETGLEVFNNRIWSRIVIDENLNNVKEEIQHLTQKCNDLSQEVEYYKDLEEFNYECSLGDDI